VVLVLKDVVENCKTNREGSTVFNLIRDQIVQNKPIYISFKDVSSISSSFLNSAFIELLKHTSYENVMRCLKIVDSNKHINDSIRRGFFLEV
jgi:hypothetical protein